MFVHPFEILGQNIRQERMKQHMTQEYLAEKAEISSVFLSQIENNRKVPSLETVYKITTCLGISMENAFKEVYISNPQIDKQIDTILKGKSEKEKQFLLDILQYMSEKMRQEETPKEI